MLFHGVTLFTILSFVGVFPGRFPYQWHHMKALSLEYRFIECIPKNVEK
jgi:hypothetical protein